ncbi:hypothetical protein vBKpnAMK6_00462 [Klebsiella phage vB_Kpn_AM_K6]
MVKMKSLFVVLMAQKISPGKNIQQKTKNTDDAERKTGGMNGVGSALTNIFSVTFVGATCDGKNEIVVRCSNGAENVSWEEHRS